MGALAAAATVLLTVTAFATTTTTTTTSATLAAGDLGITKPLTAGTFAGSLTGLPQSLAADPSAGGTDFGGFQVRVARGSGVGWSVTASAGRLVNGDGSGHDLALGSLTMPRLAVAKDNASSSAVPGTLHGAAAIDTGADGVTGGSSWPPARSARAWGPTTSCTRRRGRSPCRPTPSPAPTPAL